MNESILVQSHKNKIVSTTYALETFQRNVPGCLANPQYLELSTHCQGLLESSCTISLRMDLLLPFHHVTR